MSSFGQSVGILLCSCDHKILETLFPPDSSLLSSMGEVGQHECTIQPSQKLNSPAPTVPTVTLRRANSAPPAKARTV